MTESDPAFPIRFTFLYASTTQTGSFLHEHLCGKFVDEEKDI